MDFFKDLNVLEILKIGAIGLGFLLALMSYNLIKKEQEKTNPNSTILKSAKGFMVFSIILMMLGIMSEFIKTKPNLRVKLGNNEIELNEVSYASLSSLDTKKYFINSEFGFAFKKPNNDWSDIESLKGISGLFKIMSVKSKIITQKNIELGFQKSPLGVLFTNSSHYYFYNQKSKTNIIVTDSTENDLIKAVVKQRSKELLDTTSFLAYDTNKIEDKKDYFESLKDYRKALIGFDTLEAKEGFLLSVYPKNYLPDYLKKLKLPAFYTYHSIALGLNVDKLVANETQILGGTEITLNNVKMNNRIVDFQNKKWMMFTENDKYFFVMEINYSPQISSSIDLWDDLQETLNSFSMLNEK